MSRPAALPPSISSGYGYAAIVAATALVAGLALVGVPFDGPIGWGLLGAAVLTTGMPHGAVDHLVARRLFGLRGLRGATLFYGGYLALVALYGGVWWVWPKGALAVFVAIAAYHFGQADLAYLASGRAGWRQRAGLYLSRGAFVVGGPLLARPEAIAPVLDAIAGVQGPAGLPAWWPVASVAVLAGQHALVLWVWSGDAAIRRREGGAIVVLSGLFAAAPPLVAFAIYFGLWHALGHVVVLLRFFRGTSSSHLEATPPPPEEEAPETVKAFYRHAALYTVLPLVALAVVGAARPSALDEADVLAALFVLISILTLPHMLLVERLYRHERRRVRQAGTPPEEGSSSRSSSGVTTNEGGSLEG